MTMLKKCEFVEKIIQQAIHEDKNLNTICIKIELKIPDSDK